MCRTLSNVVHLFKSDCLAVNLFSCLFQFKWTPLHTAAVNGHSDVCQVLVQSGANVEVQTTVRDNGGKLIGICS